LAFLFTVLTVPDIQLRIYKNLQDQKLFSNIS